MATYSAPSGPGELYRTHAPPGAITACPAWTSSVPSRCSTRSIPRSTTVYSSNSGVCPGSTQPEGLCMWATLTAVVPELTRPTYSSMAFGLLPAATMRVAFGMRMGVRVIGSLVGQREAVRERQRRVLAAGRGDQLHFRGRRAHRGRQRNLPGHRGTHLAAGRHAARALELRGQRQIDS